MCQNVYAEFRCADTHEQRGEDRTRLKHIARCDTALNSPTGQSCLDPRDNVHIVQEDEPDINCPECRGETPPETP
ncbi:hypothetical protein BU26DRAFT_522317 [Trematosphaeria pertusa]|uniref:Uncharacterized protein n=1 Tax=Trematosphaeria pertusa TaxID=390896 RepID=A0A6A6I5A4_9PLEO|nr:uncharacterized protein BU26DRAFT_522317 [Trematosphaeria pertusa]KAF2245218.1 hypothetical protein BU26DRAFT_522317 [Trematosphaeria pertusa]